MDLLNQAIRIACEAHAGQVDKGGEPYILHPLRVMLNCNTMNERIVAVLHDVLEDRTEDKFRDLITDIFPLYVIEAVMSITRAKNEKYKHYIIRCSKNELVTRVKMADLRDNLDARRRGTRIYGSLMERYHKALTYLDAYSRNEQNIEYEDVGA